MTPKLDSIAIEFVKRIPTSFKSTFTPNMIMPDTYFMPALQVVDYINRAMMALFNDYWQSVKGDASMFARIFPELVRYTPQIRITNGLYVIAAPYLDFKKIIGGLAQGSINSNYFIKVWDDTKLTIALSGLYDVYTTTSNKPAMIQMNNSFYLFPDALESSVNNINLHYIGIPVNPVTGSALVQNDNYDSPFSAEWNSVIADHAEQLFLQDSYQTT
jgi:hypothetical protein